MLDDPASAAHEPPGVLGEDRPGTDARGISLRGFLKAFPDEQACLEFLFWVRGGPALECRLCGRPTRWIDRRQNRLFYSSCCATTVSATRHTMFHKSRIPLWDRFYAVMLTLSLSASPSVGFLARHLGVSDNTAWNLLRKMREQFSAICAQGSRCLRDESVAIQHLRFWKMQTARGRHTLPINVLTVATERNAFAYVMPKRHPADVERILDRLGVRRHVYVDVAPNDVLLRLRGYTVEQLTAAERSRRPELWRVLCNSIRFGLYLQYNLRRWPVSVRRSYLQNYLAEFVLRFNFAHDKAMMFPLFMSSLGRVQYAEDWPRHFGRRRLDNDLPQMLPG